MNLPPELSYVDVTRNLFDFNLSSDNISHNPKIPQFNRFVAYLNSGHIILRFFWRGVLECSRKRSSKQVINEVWNDKNF